MTGRTTRVFSFIAPAAMLALAACGVSVGSNQATNTTETNVANDQATNTSEANVSVAAEDSKTADNAAPVDPQIAAEVARAAAEIRETLPKQVDNITTLTAIGADGTQFVYHLTVNSDFSSDQIAAIRERMQSNNQTALCGNPDSRRIMELGGSMRHIYTDSSGDSFETVVTSCAGGGGKS